MGALERIQKELSDFNSSPVEGCSAGPQTSDYFLWSATIQGPAGTPYENGIFFLDIQFPQEYPFRPPSVAFRTPIYHLNVSEKGVPSVSMLKDGWSPALTIPQVLLNLRRLLVDPEPENPLRPDLLTQWQQSRDAYNAKAREFTATYAM